MTQLEAQKRGAGDGSDPRMVGPARTRLFRGHILVVEDDELVRESVALLFQRDGYEVSSAANGHEALTWLYRENRPDLIVLDLRMPVMNGWEFRAIQNRDRELRKVPVVAISADGSAQAAAISAQAYLQRPFDAKKLLETAARVLCERVAEVAAPHQAMSDLRTAWADYTATLGHQLNNPLFVVLLNLEEAITDLWPSLHLLETGGSGGRQLDEIKASLRHVAARLEDCKVGADRIRETLSGLGAEASAYPRIRPLLAPPR